MKKIISICISLMLICSSFSVVFATDAQGDKVEQFKNFAEANEYNFHENYYFIDTFGESESSDNFLLRFSNSSSVAVTGCIAEWGYEGDTDLTLPSESWSIIKNPDATESDDILQSDNTYITIPANGYVDVWSMSTMSDALDNYYGFALQNYLELTDNTTVTLEVYSMQWAEDMSSYTLGENAVATIKKTFDAPVSFKNDTLEPLENILTNLEFDKDYNINYQDAVNSLSALANLNYENDEDEVADKNLLDEKLTESVMEKIATVIAENNGGKEIVKTSNGVTLPYVALVKAPANGGSTYIVEAIAGNDGTTTISDVDYNTKAYDIKILVDNNEVSSPAVKQKVVIDLPNGWADTGVKYQHNNDGNWIDVDKVENNQIVFYADSFSTYTIAGTSTTVNSSVSQAQYVKFDIIQDDTVKNKFSLVITPGSNLSGTYQLQKFATAAMRYEFHSDSEITEDLMKNFTYKIEEVNGISITSPKNVEKSYISDDTLLGGFEFVATVDDGNLLSTKEIDGVTVVEDSIKIADLYITGTGNFIVNSMSSEKEDKNIYTESHDNNIAIPVSVHNMNSAVLNIPKQMYDATFIVKFPNTIKSTDDSYLGMSITIEGSITKEEKVISIGSDEFPVSTNETTGETSAKCTLKLNGNETYTFVIEGKGYRTFSDSVYLDGNKTINLWNNALTNEKVNVIDDDNDTAKAITFLVGDIYMDGIVDVYDLSAVTSYYNPDRAITIGVDGNYDKYIAYDLNRDGRISLTDIAYVQVSYGN